jgi:hypothetical protein
VVRPGVVVAADVKVEVARNVPGGIELAVSRIVMVAPATLAVPLTSNSRSASMDSTAPLFGVKTSTTSAGGVHVAEYGITKSLNVRPSARTVSVPMLHAVG